MKKFLSLFACVLFVACLGTAAFASVDNVYEVAVIDAKGDAKVDKMAVGNWTPVSVGQKLRTDAIIKTGKGASVQIVFDAEGLNVLKIKENTQITVKKALVELEGGGVLADFGNIAQGSSFTVKTPNAACAIRGSGMGVDYLSNLTIVLAFEHNVYVTGYDANGNVESKEVTIPQDWRVVIGATGVIQPPTGLSDNEKLIWDAWVAVVAPDASEKKLDKEEKEVDAKDLVEDKDKDEKKEISPCQ